jgi:hypothetical protein
LGDEAFLSKKAKGKSWKEQERLVNESKLPPYPFVKNSPIGQIDPRGLNTGKIWGNWCGSGWTAGQSMESTDYDWENDPNPKVVDGLDACCKKHDACWANWDLDNHKKKTGPLDTDKCDDLLCDCARSNVTVNNSVANGAIQCAMCSRRNAPDPKAASCCHPIIKIGINF